MPARLPNPGSDTNVWGVILNDFLTTSHNPDGTLKDSVVTPSKLEVTSAPTANQVLSTDGTAFKWASVSGSGVVADADGTTKGIIQLTNALTGTAASPALTQGYITNAHISASAAIDQTKIAGLGGAASLNVGQAANTVAAGNDIRFNNNEKTTNKNVAGGYAGLDSNGRVLSAQLGSGASDSTKYLRGDGSWQTLSIPATYTDAQAKAAAGATATNTSTVNLTYNTGAEQLSASVRAQQSIDSTDPNGLKLSGDSSAPGNGKYYGTNTVGTKGFHDLPSNSPALTTKGDLVVRGGSGSDQRLSVGTDNQVLVADSAQSLGVKWGAIPAHVASHKAGGSDQLTPYDIGAASAASLQHGLLSDKLSDSAAHSASQITQNNAGMNYATGTNVQTALSQLDGAIKTRLDDHQALSVSSRTSIGAHPASAISIAAISGLNATDVQGALQDLKSTIGGGGGGGGGSPMFSKYRSGGYVGPSIIGGTFSTTAISPGVIRAVPFLVGATNAVSFDRIGIEVVTGAVSSLGRLGVYSDSNTNGGAYPGALVFDAGTVDCTNSGVFQEITLNTPLSLQAGVYWLVYQGEGSGSPTIRVCTGTSQLVQPTTPTIGGNNSDVYYGLAGQSLGSLPVTFPSGATVGSGGPRVMLRAL